MKPKSKGRRSMMDPGEMERAQARTTANLQALHGMALVGDEASREILDDALAEVRVPFGQALEAFGVALQAKLDRHYDQTPRLKSPLISFEHGSRYVRVVRTDRGISSGCSVYCFIDKTNGDILLPAGWKGPAKHGRGSIYATDPVVFCGIHGVAYLK